MKQVWRSSTVVLFSAMVGSFVPLLPFFFTDVEGGIISSLIVSAITLFAVGVYKAKATVGKPLRSGLELLLIGMIAALIGYAIGALFKAPTLP